MGSKNRRKRFQREPASTGAPPKVPRSVVVVGDEPLKVPASVVLGEEATPKERFDLLFGMLKKFQEGLIDFEFKHGTALFAILAFCAGFGQDIQKTSSARIIITIAVCSMNFFHFIWVCMQWKASTDVYERLKLFLKSHNYVQVEDIETQRIYRVLAISFVVTYLALSMLILAAVLIPVASG
jgi:hypothetical protein